MRLVVRVREAREGRRSVRGVLQLVAVEAVVLVALRDRDLVERAVEALQRLLSGAVADRHVAGVAAAASLDVLGVREHRAELRRAGTLVLLHLGRADQAAVARVGLLEDRQGLPNSGVHLGARQIDRSHVKYPSNGTA